jgi:EF hand
MPRTSSAALVGLLLTAAWCDATPALSEGAASDALREADRGTFAAADLNGDGKITRPEHVHFTDLVFLSIDGAGDEAVTLEEFLAWDPGYV